MDYHQVKKENEALIDDVKAILKGEQKAPEDILDIARKLHKLDEFGWARKILEQAVNNGIENSQTRQEIIQKLALSTYKDSHVNRELALNQALKVLQDEFDMATISDQETLGIAGAIYKRKWETNGLKKHLEHALIYYQRGYKEGVEGDDGYTAINAAFIQNLLAYLENKQTGGSGVTFDVAAERQKDAFSIRETIIEYLSKVPLDKQSYWSMVTLAEAYFGTQQYAQARTWLNNIRSTPDIAEWEYVSFAKQLVHLAKLQADINISEQEMEKTEAVKVLIEFMGDKAYALRSMYRGKVGLALSGGGFRASFYHIGVLAKLAELDLLRHIEVLSCVSGGSILGTHYYLELRRLINIEGKYDKDIGRNDYVQLVHNIVDDFLAGVQQNPRVRLLANPWTNLKMLFFSSYSHTQKLGELYEKLIYKRVKDGEGDKERWINDLYIQPKDPVEQKKFIPKRDNWFRQCKIPELVLNATTLNTGHNWQFTASWMGESPAQIDPDIDSNDRYRRTYYDDAPEPHKNIRLGSAVGASSCVPGLFEPLILQGLYPARNVRLVDGGVYDNQGVAGLIEQDCNVIISSDASGQMNSENDPGGGVLQPLLRTNSTLMQRVRDSQYQDLKARKRSGILRDFVYVHLKQGLDSNNIDWVNSTEPKQSPPNPDAKTECGIRQDIQTLLAGVRTDLDSFSDIEAYALMMSGYSAIETSIEHSLTEFPVHQGEQPKWKFLQVEAAMKQDIAGGEEYEHLKSSLEAAPMKFGKAWKLHKKLNIFLKLMLSVLLFSLIYLWYNNPDWQPFSYILNWLGNQLTIGLIMWSLVILFIVSLVSTFMSSRHARFVKQAFNFRGLSRRIVIGLGVGIVGWIGAFIHLHIFDKLFQKLGQIKPKNE